MESLISCTLNDFCILCLFKSVLCNHSWLYMKISCDGWFPFVSVWRCWHCPVSNVTSRTTRCHSHWLLQISALYHTEKELVTYKWWRWCLALQSCHYKWSSWYEGKKAVLSFQSSDRSFIIVHHSWACNSAIAAITLLRRRGFCPPRHWIPLGEDLGWLMVFIAVLLFIECFLLSLS